MLYHSKAKREKEAKKRLAERYDLSGRPTAAQVVRMLLHAEPHWGPILRECVIVAEQRKESGKFAGAWVMQGLRAQGIETPNNLRTLARLGLLTLLSTARHGNRAYYTIPDPKSITKALKEGRQ
jgi:hypothetical protein